MFFCESPEVGYDQVLVLLLCLIFCMSPFFAVAIHKGVVISKSTKGFLSCKFSHCIEYQTIGGIVSKETVCCVGGKVKH